MTREHAGYRLRMATGFLTEAQQDVSLKRCSHMRETIDE